MKKLTAILLALLIAVSAAACGNNESSGGAGDTALTEDGLFPSLTAAVAMEMQNLLPFNGNGNPKNQFYWNIYESLFDYNADLELVPDLAKNYEVIDGTHWQVNLFEEIYDSAGNHITAEDVVFSVNYLIQAGEAINYDNFESVEATGEYSVLYTWKSTPTSTSQLEFPFVRTYIVDSEQFDENAYATKPIGTGNYVVDSFVTGSEMVLKYNHDYWANKTSEDVSARLALHNGTVETLTYRIIQESASAEIELDMGTIDFCDYIKALSIPKYEGNEKYVVDVNYASDYTFIGFNMDPLSDVSGDLNLRLAIAYALDSKAIAEAMPGSFTAMTTYGTPWFSDYDEAWESDSNYSNTTDLDKAKDYLAKSDYAKNGSPTITVICKSTEQDKNAVQMILAQLQALGLNVEMKSVDAATFQNDTGNPANYDLLFFSDMGGKNLVGSWNLALNNTNKTTSDGKGGSVCFIADDTLVSLYNTANSDATHNSENMKKVIDYVYENAYIYPLAYSVSARIYQAEKISQLYFREGNTTLLASTYAGQPVNKDPAGHGQTITGEDVTAYAGSYTFEEAMEMGSGLNSYVLTLNADGSYRLDQHNIFGEDVFIEGSFMAVDGQIVCAAPEKGVQGAMDRMLTSGWTDMEKPASTWILNGDGTATPVGYDPDAAGGGQPPQGGGEQPPAGDGEEPGILGAFAGMGFDRFDWSEESPVGVIPWHLLIKNGEDDADGNETGEYCLVVENPHVGNADGLLVYHGTFVKQGPIINLSAPDESADEVMRLGGMWNTDGTSVWTISSMGVVAPEDATA